MPPRSRNQVSETREAGPDLRTFFSELVRLETELWNAVEARLRSGHGVTLPFFEFMQIIARQPQCRVHDIATELAITVGGTSKIVDRIEAAGYCTRHANPSDRRSSIITLTPAGKRLLPRLIATVDDELRARVSTEISDRSLTQLTRILTRLRAAGHAVPAAERTALPAFLITTEVRVPGPFLGPGLRRRGQRVRSGISLPSAKLPQQAPCS